MGKKFRGKDVPERTSRLGAGNKKMRTRTRGNEPAEEEVEEIAPPRKAGRKSAPVEVPEEVDLEMGVGDTHQMNALDDNDPLVDLQNEGAITADVGPVPGAPQQISPGSSGQVGSIGDNLSLEFEQPSSTTRRLTCTKCHSDFEVDMSQVGKEIICPTCNNRFLLTSKDIQKQVELLTHQVNTLRIQVEQTNGQVTHYQTLAQNNRTKLEQAVAAGREVDAERERLAQELDKIQRQGLGGRAGPAVDEMRARLDTVEAQRKSLEIEVKDLRGKLQRHENRTTQLENDNSNLNVELQLLRSKLAAMDSKGGPSKEELADAQAALAKQKSVAADLQHRIDELEGSAGQIKDLTTRQARLQGEAEDAKRKMADLEQQLARAKAAPAGPSREAMQELKERINELEQVANQRKDEIKHLKEQLSGLQGGHGEVEQALEKARRRNQEQADEIADLQRKLKAAENAQSERDAASGKSSDEVRDLRAKVAERDRTISEMNQKLHVKSEALEGSARELQEKGRHLAERESRLQELTGNLNRRENEMRDLQHQLSDKDRQIAEKLRHIGTVQQRVQDLERALEDAARNKGGISDDQHKLMNELKGQLADVLRQAAQADRDHVQEVLKTGHELRDTLKKVGSLEGEIESLQARLASAQAAAPATGGSTAATEALKARVAELTAMLDKERATVLDLKRRLTNGSDRFWAPVTTHLTQNFGVFRVGGEKDNHEYFDVLFPRGTELPKPGELLTVKRAAYRPKHNLGNMQYLLATDVKGDQPEGDINKMHRVVFPFDKTIDPSGRYAAGDTKVLNKAADFEIAETYFCNHEGLVTCEFERQVDGKIMRWSFSLVTLKSTN